MKTKMLTKKVTISLSLLTACLTTNALVVNFNGLDAGDLVGQGDWFGTGDTPVTDHFQVVADPLADDTDAFRGNVLEVSPNTEGTWASLPRANTVIKEFSFDFSVTDDPQDAEEPRLWIRYANGFPNHLAVFLDSVNGDVLEVNFGGGGGNTLIPVDVAEDTVHNFKVVYVLDGPIATGAEVFFDGESVGVIDGYAIDMTGQDQLQVRGWDGTFYFDNFALTEAAAVHNFDSFDAGDLAGQGGWFGTGDEPVTDHFQVAADPTEGASAFDGNVLSIAPNEEGTFIAIARSFTVMKQFSMDFSITDDGDAENEAAAIWIRFGAGWPNHLGLFLDHANSEGADVVEVNFGGGGGNKLFPVDFTEGDVHNLTVVYNLTGSTAMSAEIFFDGTSIGVYDDRSADFSVGRQLEIRGWRGAIDVDNVMILGAAQSYTYDDLAVGPIDGQAGWHASDPLSTTDQFQVIADPTEGASAFSGNVLSIASNAESTWMITTRPRGITSEFSMDISITDDPQVATAPQVWLRFGAGWANHVAVFIDDAGDDTLEVNLGGSGGNTAVPVDFTLDTVHNVRIAYVLDGTTATGADVYFDGELVQTIEGFEADIGVGDEVQIRAWNGTTYIDNVFLASADPLPMGPGVFSSYPLIDDVWVETGKWLGLVSVEYYPWIYLYDIDTWGYVHENGTSAGGGWIYMLNLN